MNIDDIQKWIAIKNVELFQLMQHNVVDNEIWNRARGAYDILEQLSHHILMMTNPHNRKT